MHEHEHETNTSETATSHDWRTLWNRVQASFPALADWTVETTGQSGREGFCWHGRKRIDLGIDQPPLDACRLLLHEVAHALRPADEQPPHNAAWWLTYGALLHKFLDAQPPSRSDMLAAWPAWDTAHELIGRKMGKAGALKELHRAIWAAALLVCAFTLVVVLFALARPAHADELPGRSHESRAGAPRSDATAGPGSHYRDPIATAREARDWGTVARLADERIALQAAAERPLFTDRPAGRASLDHRGNGTAEASMLVQRWAAILAGESFRRWDHDTGHVGVELALPLQWVAHRATGAEAHTLQLRARLTLGSSFRQGSTLTGESVVGFGFASGSWQAGGQFFAWFGKRHNGDWFASLAFEHRDGWGSDDDPFGWRAGIAWEGRFGRNFDADLSLNGQHTVLLRGAFEWRPSPSVCVVAGLAFAPVRAAASQANTSGDHAGLVWEGLTAFVAVEYRGG